jgi:hypothetical protein
MMGKNHTVSSSLSMRIVPRIGTGFKDSSETGLPGWNDGDDLEFDYQELTTRVSYQSLSGDARGLGGFADIQ